MTASSNEASRLHGIGLSSVEPELKQQFEFLIGERSYLEHRWEDYSGWTLPYLFPHQEKYNTTEMQNDYQSLGAQATNHLANKISNTLFPPNRPFFKAELTQSQSAFLQSQGVTEADMEVMTSRAERASMRAASEINLRTASISVMKNLIVLGNSLIYYPDKKGEPTQVYSLRDYVIKRDMSGDILQIITRDRKAVETLPPEFRTQMMGEGFHDDQRIDLYTGITRRENTGFFVKQELEAEVVTTTGVFPEKDLPWNALTWNLVRGQDYGNGLVEEYGGDFHVISSLSEANVNLAAIASDIKILVNPMGQTDVDTLNNSEAGTYVYGLPTDVAYLQMEKLNELQFVNTFLDKYERRVSSAFMLNTQVTRDAERVTAEEIRMNVNELEASLGGVYSHLAERMQVHAARKLLTLVDPELASMQPVILTGVASLTRNNEHEQMLLFMQDLGVLAQVPEPLIPFLKYDQIATMLAANRGIEYGSLLKTQDEVEAEQAAEQQAQQEAAMGEAVAQGVGEQVGSAPGAI